MFGDRSAAIESIVTVCGIPEQTGNEIDNCSTVLSLLLANQI